MPWRRIRRVTEAASTISGVGRQTTSPAVATSLLYGRPPRTSAVESTSIHGDSAARAREAASARRRPPAGSGAPVGDGPLRARGSGSTAHRRLRRARAVYAPGHARRAASRAVLAIPLPASGAGVFLCGGAVVPADGRELPGDHADRP